jgi:CheY-like chemotaxis protein
MDRNIGRRQWNGDAKGRSRPCVRTLLHHQGNRQGERSGTVPRLWIRASVRWVRYAREPRRRWQRLSVYLPPSAKPIEVPRTPDELREISAARTGTVLVVEDDATVLALAIGMFNDLGFRVITASDAHGALEIIRRGEPIDLLFTDIVMPGGKTGVELAVEARDFLPNVKILLTSGYPGEALAHHCSVETEWPMISKPFRQSELAVRLQHIFGG